MKYWKRGETKDDESNENDEIDDRISKLELKFFSYMTMWYLVRFSNFCMQVMIIATLTLAFSLHLILNQD